MEITATYPIKDKYSPRDKINMTTTALKERASLRNVQDVAFLSQKYGEGILDYVKDNINMNEVLKYYTPSLDFIRNNNLLNDNEKRDILFKNYNYQNFDDYMSIINEYRQNFSNNSFSERDVSNIIDAAKNFARFSSENSAEYSYELIKAFEKEISDFQLWDIALNRVKMSLDYIYKNRDDIITHSKRPYETERYIEYEYGTIEYMKSFVEKGDGTSDFYKDGTPVLKDLDDSQLKVGDRIHYTQHNQFGYDIKIVNKDLTIDNVFVDKDNKKHYHASVEEWDFYADKCYTTTAEFTENDFYKVVFPNKSYYEEHYLSESIKETYKDESLYDSEYIETTDNCR